MLSVGLLWLALRNVDLHAVRSSLVGARLPWVALSALGVNVGLIAMAIRWRMASEPSGPTIPSRRRFFATILTSIAANNLLPARPGDLLRILWSGKATGGGIARAASVALADRGCDVIVLTAVLGISLPFVRRDGWVAAIAIAALAIALILVSIVIACRWWSGRRHEHPDAGRFRAMRERFAATMAGIATPSRSLRMLSATVLLWSSWAVGAWAAARALGVHLSLAEALLLTAVINLGIAIPSSPGFVGTYQWLTVEALGLAGVDRSVALAVSVILHAVWFIPTTIVGLALLPRLGLSLRSLMRPGTTLVGAAD